LYWFSDIATASSVDKTSEAHFAIDGLAVSSGPNIFITELEFYPWFQLEFVNGSTIVTGVTITNRNDCCGEKFRKVSIRVGDEPAVGGRLETNTECSFFKGPSATGRIDQIMCTKPLVGKYLQVQLTKKTKAILQINEIKVMTKTLTDTVTYN
jgi:uncharacterized Zn-binding protein involved in type VI secretion